MEKLKLILTAIFIWTAFCPAAAQISEKKDRSVSPSYQTREELMEVLNFHYPAGNSLRGEIPMTRREFAAIMSDYLNDLIHAAVRKLKIKNEAEYFELVRKNPSYAVSSETVYTGISDPSQKKFLDANSLGLEMRNLNRLVKMGVDICDADLLCRPEQKVTEKEFYRWLQRIFGISLKNAPASDQPVIRARMVNFLGDALWSSYQKINNFAAAAPESSPKTEIVRNLPPLGRARITDKSKFYPPDSPCADLSGASGNLKTAFTGGGVWGDYRINKGDEGDIVFETANTCEKGRIVLLRVGTAIVTMSEKGVKKLN